MLRRVGHRLSAELGELVHAARRLSEQLEELQALRAGQRRPHHRDRLEDGLLRTLLLHISYSIDYLITRLSASTTSAGSSSTPRRSESGSSGSKPAGINLAAVRPSVGTAKT